MTVAVNFLRDSEKAGERSCANFAYAVQVAVLELREVRADVVALAVENAKLRHAMAVTLEHVSVMNTGQAGVAAMIINDALHHSETPATDSFLAEVRAQGVEMFANHKRLRQQGLRSRNARLSEEAAGMAADAEDFAAQLRQGASQ
ncbi:hypothetical protein M8013_20600 [Enterobacteriaceae bacterium H4N4]|uniref:Uncharacterized protein n=2 Tax=Silvania confinis TaxID=2926470 RepID=A0A9J6QLE9_9ENTR|nr:hypothetical protein [Silvania confinis]MCU6671131.1 hypothetical protein [Silvania confinis]